MNINGYNVLLANDYALIKKAKKRSATLFQDFNVTLGLHLQNNSIQPQREHFVPEY